MYPYDWPPSHRRTLRCHDLPTRESTPTAPPLQVSSDKVPGSVHIPTTKHTKLTESHCILPAHQNRQLNPSFPRPRRQVPKAKQKHVSISKKMFRWPPFSLRRSQHHHPLETHNVARQASLSNLPPHVARRCHGSGRVQGATVCTLYMPLQREYGEAVLVDTAAPPGTGNAVPGCCCRDCQGSSFLTAHHLSYSPDAAC